MSLPNFADDAPQAIAEFGEISTHLMTFTRDIVNYASTTNPDSELFVFRSVDEMENRTLPSAGFVSGMLAFGQWIHNQLKNNTIPPNRNKSAFIQTIMSQFPNMLNVDIGEIVSSNIEADLHCPDYVSFQMMDGTYRFQTTLWFIDSAMRRQYEHFEIFIIPPVPDISQLINTKPNVHAILAEQTSDVLIRNIQNIVKDQPNTALQSFRAQWHDPNDFNAVLNTEWTAVIYGEAGNDDEAIKEKIKEYILDHSNYTKWPEIYPDLYTETEYAFFPMWNKFALSENAVQVGIYSPMVRLKDLRNVVKTFLPSGYQEIGKTVDVYLEDNLFAGSANYRTISFGCVGNPNNVDGKVDIQMLYPDLNLALGTMDADFGRMSLVTQEFCTRLHAALDVAREYDPSIPLPAEYNRVTRRGNYFISFRYNNFIYVLLTKYSFEKSLQD